MENIYLFHGEDSYTSIQKANFWRNEFEKKYGDLNSQLFEGEDLTYGAFQEAVATMPFLSDKKLIIVRNAFKDTPTDELKKIADNIENTPDHCIVVFAERKKADSRTSLFKKLKKLGKVTEFNLMDRYELTQWIKKEMQKTEAQIGQTEINYLADTVGPNLWQMKSEIEKITLNANDRQITKQDIDNLTSPNIEITIFKLTDSLAQKRRKESLKSLKILIDSGENLVQTFFMIVRHFRILIQIKDCTDKKMSGPQIIKKTKLHPFVVNKSISQTKNFTTETLEQIYKILLQIDIAMKSGKIRMTTDDQTELRLSLEKFIAEFCC